MRIKVPIIILFTAFLLVPYVVYGQPMSELNLEGFYKDKEEIRGAAGAKSPFVPSRPSLREMMLEDLFLNGVAIGPGGSYALINGHVLAEGDSVAGLRVKSIGKKKVILQYLDKLHTLYLEGGM